MSYFLAVEKEVFEVCLMDLFDIYIFEESWL